MPNSITDNALIRISANNGNSTSISNTSFTIIDVPSNLTVYWPCPDSINVSWNSVNGATSYDISMLGQKYMDSIFSTSSTDVWVINPNPSVTESWFSVRANPISGKGRRAVAVNAQSINSVCSGNGCTDSLAYNYTPLAVVNDGSCCYISGCTDVTSVNYDSTACYDNGSCLPAILGCTNPNATNFDPLANTTLWFGGALDNTFGTGGYFNGDQHLIFDATKACIIKSAKIYAEAANTITFELRDDNGSVIDDTTLNVVLGEQRIALNFNVPIGNDMQLGVAQGALQNDGLYRNNASANYPYNIGNLINITSSSASSAPFGYYYFYYDIEIEENCKSEYKQITAVLNSPLSTPVISQNGSQLSTTNNPTYTYQWYLNGVVINGANAATLNISQTGQYSVDIEQNGCFASSANFSAIYSGVNEQVQQIFMHPNPCLLYTSPSPRDGLLSRMPSSA